jgi:hypothetical protein
MPDFKVEAFRTQAGLQPGVRPPEGFAYSSDGNDHFLSLTELQSLVQQEIPWAG